MPIGISPRAEVFKKHANFRVCRTS
jgi:hypothetical protein